MSYHLIHNEDWTGSQIPNEPGTYVLFFHLAEPLTISPGRLGTHHLDSGWYAYVGSARGPGGLAARVARHLRPAAEKRCHWHVDHLTARAHVERIAWAVGDDRQECQWARRLLALPGSSVPIPRFGASDCTCPAHLIRVPSAAAAYQALTAAPPGSAPG
ncbi:MAG: GIY-YIG nuclease family protein [Chloroflexi bacterium]|nr:GIY-YIG nuclease family protein [Chloroflexota bacterium]